MLPQTKNKEQNGQLLTLKSNINKYEKTLIEATGQLINYLNTQLNSQLSSLKNIETKVIQIHQKLINGKNLDNKDLKLIQSFPVTLNLNIQEIMNYYKCEILSFYESLNDRLYSNSDSSVFESESLVYITDKDLHSYNVLDSTDTVKKLNISHDFSLSSFICPISKDFIFLYGGPNIASYYVYDIQKNKVVKTGSNKVKWLNGCCFYNESVYVFGGNSQKGALNESQRYILSSDQ